MPPASTNSATSITWPTKRSRVISRPGRGWLPWLGLGIILLLALFLRFYQLGQAGYNQYYAATVQSMLTSAHNFFYAAYEPGGSVSVDKPPLGFWLQAASAAIFGINGFALALPQVLAGLLAIPLLYHLVQRQFGVWAGLLAALTLAITPVTVSTERNNTIDGTLVLLLLLAAWAFIRATESGRVRFLWLGAVLVGLGFNVKMLQAFLPLPAFYALYLVGAPQRWWRKLLHLAAAGLLLLVVSLSWAVAVDLTPPENRPYVGSSSDNSVMELILGHNGLARLLPGGRQLATRLFGDDSPDAAPAGNQANTPNTPANPPGAAPNAGNAPGGINQEIGDPGPLRLFTEPLVTEAGWLLPLALFSLLLVLVTVRWQWPPAGKHLAAFLWGGWLLTELLFFSVASLYHAYYLIMLGPPLAALVGMGGWALWQQYRQRPWLGWLLAGTASLLTLGTQWLTLRAYPDQAAWLLPLSLLLALVGLGGLLLLTLAHRPAGGLPKIALAIALAATLAAPAAWAFSTTLNSTPNVNLPRSGPATGSTPGAVPNAPGAPAGNQPAQTGSLNQQQQARLNYLTPRTSANTYLAWVRNYGSGVTV